MAYHKGRAKGNRWDKEVAGILSEWFFGVPDGLIKTHGSRNVKGYSDQVGDLGIAKAGLRYPWVFGVENKHRDAGGKKSGAWTIDDILQMGKTAPILDYWKQCKDAADAGNKIPLLIAKRNYMKPIAMLRAKDYFAVEQKDYHPPMMLQVYNRRLVIMRLSSLLEWTEPETWVSHWELTYNGRTTGSC